MGERVLEPWDMFQKTLETYSVTEIAKHLNLARGTVVRWQELESVPPQYLFDLYRMNGIDIDYSQFSDKEKDQFFTSPQTAEYCYNKAREIITSLGDDFYSYTQIEPSAGDGAFYNLMPKGSIGLDIEPRTEGVLTQDYFFYEPDTNNNIVIGNPPFGLRGHLALRFINHSAKFADYVCFILPQLFASNGKGSTKSRVEGMNLIHSETVPSDFHFPDGKDVGVNVVFQVWSKHHSIAEETYDVSDIMKVYSLSDGGSPSSTRNKDMLYKCDFYLPSTCFGKESMHLYSNFEDLPHRRGYGIVAKKHIASQAMNAIDWSDVAFPSTNGAMNLRFDIIEKAVGNYVYN